MSKPKTYPVPAEVAARAHINAEQYREMYQRSVESPAKFWAEQAEKFIDWQAPWNEVMSADFHTGDIKWFHGAKLNACYNCVDRHLSARGRQTALLWQGNEPYQTYTISYYRLFTLVCKFGNALKSRGVKKGDRVALYMPMIPEAIVAMLACARIGAIHSVVFGGFSPEALRERILDSDCRVVITADEAPRGEKYVPLKENVNRALEGCPNVHTVFMAKRTGLKVAMDDARDVIYEYALEAAADDCPCEEMDAEDPLFILYTSGSTGKPKGVLHTTGGYLLYAAMTHKYVFDYHDGEVYWCTADVGWVTGHSYIVYGPLANGATTLVFEGIPTYPDASRFWQICDAHQVNIFYTAPTALRALMAQGDAFVRAASRKSLRILGTVGEPINPEAWEWYYQVVGDARCRVVDTWWQTETGGIMITPLPGAATLKPGSAALPFFGISPALLDAEGNEIYGTGAGNLVIKKSWPGQMRTVYGDHQRFVDTYFSQYPGVYTTGDGARRDADGYYWITGRVDDVLNVSGHRLGTAEVESALVLHKSVAEAAVVGFPHEIKGQGIYAFVTPMVGVKLDGAREEKLRAELMEFVKNEIGAIAKPEVIQFAPGLPKTRSGKIMRRILRKIAAGEVDDLGDTSTLAEPGVVRGLIKKRAGN